MKTIGLDIGTTTICGVLLDAQTGVLLGSKTLQNTTAAASAQPWERAQNPNEILTLCRQIISEFLADALDVSAIGITNQMHGMVYLNSAGEAISPLYTWQDERGSLPAPKGGSYAAHLSTVTGYPMATGYGLTTHYYNLQNNLVPADAVCVCTIGDYVAAALAGVAVPLMHSSNAASFGLFDLAQNSFDGQALAAAGIAPQLLPSVTSRLEAVGKTPEGLLVSVAVGDNQASFLGSVADDSSILVNVGTSGQISVAVPSPISAPGVETRPLLGSSLLAVGCSLCGGDSYAALRRFFEETARFMGYEAQDLYPKMNAAAEKVYQQQPALNVCTQLRGTRQDPTLRGSIANLGTDNFTPAQLTLGVLRGICNELHDIYKAMPLAGGQRPLVGSGNAIRKNPLLQKIFSDCFGASLKIPLYEEEAAFGMALMALCLADGRTPAEARSLIRYQ